MIETYPWLPSAFVFIIFLSTMLSAGVAALAWRWRKRSALGRYFLRLMIATAGWAGFSFVQMFVSDARLLLLLEHLTYACVALAPVYCLFTAVAYTGREQWLRPAVRAVILTVPVLTQLIFALAPDLFITNISYAVIDGFTFSHTYDQELWFRVHTFYSYALILSALTLLTYEAATKPSPYNRQTALLVVGMVIPFGTNILTLFFLDVPSWDWTVLVFTITTTIWAWALYHYRMLDLMPVARSAIIENMADAVVVLDDQNRIMDINPQALQLLGREDETDLVGKPLVQHMTDTPHLVSTFQNITETETELTLRDRIYELRIAGVRHGRYILMRDITARKEAEAERERLIGELNAYAHTVAHDLKNPLSTLINSAGFLEELQDEGDSIDSPDVTFTIETIVRTSRKMTTIIEELLLLASVRDQKEVALAPLAMKKIVQQAIERMALQLQTAVIDWEWHETDPPTVGYEAWVEEVWVNYLSNAAKYGGNPPHIRIGADPAEDGHRRYWIEDNGPGLTAEQQANLFVKFNRLDQHVRAEGHGLGLSIVQRIVERLNGTVGVESEPETGSRFFFTLPIHPNHPQNE